MYPSEHKGSWATLRWNFTWTTLSGALFQFGATFADTGTVVAAFVGRLTASALAVGAAESIARYGWLLPQLFAANYAQGRRYRKPIYLIGGYGRAIFLALLAGVLLVAPELSVERYAIILLAVFFVLWTLFSFISGLAGVPYNDIVGRVIPPQHRSRLLAGRFFVGGILAVGAGGFIRIILQRDNTLLSYGIIFGTGAVVLALSTSCFALVREPPAPNVGQHSGFGPFLRGGWQVLQSDRRFRLFLSAQWLAGLTAMAIPFYIVQARRVSGLAEAEAGTLVAAQMLGGVLFNPLWGWWGDRRGKLSLLKAIAVSSAISPALALELSLLPALSPAATILSYGMAFFFLGATLNGGIIADLGYLMEISPDNRRPEYSGYMNALVSPTKLLPLGAGVLVEVISFQFLFSLALLAVLARWVVLAKLGGR